MVRCRVASDRWDDGGARRREPRRRRYPFVVYVARGWRFANLIFALLPLLQLVLQRRVPESRFVPDAAASRKEDDAAAKDVDVPPGWDGGGATPPPSWWDLREPLAVGGTLAALQPLSGINIFTSYSTALYKVAGLTEPIVGTIVGNAALLICSGLAVALVERLGRRDLLRLSCATMAASGCLAGVTMYVCRADALRTGRGDAAAGT